MLLGNIKKLFPESRPKGRRAGAGAHGLRSRSYFGGVGSAGRPVAFFEPVKVRNEKQGGSRRTPEQCKS
jgi:hypothetical protein